MSLLSSLRAAASHLFHHSSSESDLAEELRAHIQHRADDLHRSGLPRREAEHRARIEFGGPEKVKEECREQRGGLLLETVLQDARYALRVLGRTPVVTAVALLSLALGIGANTAIFTLIDSVMLRFLPVHNPEELVQLYRLDPSRPGQPDSSFTNPLWEQVRDHQNIFSGAFAWSSTQFDLAPGGVVENVNGLYTSGGFFSTLGVAPAAGRLISDSDDQRGCPALAVISYRFWQDHFGGQPNAIGSSLRLNNHPFRIIGASGPDFYGVDPGNKFDVAIPVCAIDIFDGQPSHLDHRSFWWLNIIGRSEPNLPADQLKARLSVLAPQVFAGALPQDWEDKDKQRFLHRTLLASPAATGTSYLREQFSQPLYILMSVVALVLLIACANIASLMLARAGARRREIAVRKALGASRSRLIRQLLTECLLLSAGGAVLGILLARGGTALLVRYISTADNQISLDLSSNWRVLAFTVAIAVLTGLLFGILPAIRSTRISLTSAMKGSDVVERTARTRLRPAKWIVSTQVALSLVLLVVAALFLHSLRKLASLDLGFDRGNVLVVNANLKSAHSTVPEQNAIFDQIEARFRSLPGVAAVGRSFRTPVSNFEWNQNIRVDSPDAPQGEDALVYFNFVSPGYFPALRTPILQGRNFTVTDTSNSPAVVIVNETFARKFFPKSQALGQLARRDDGPKKPSPPIQIVGIVRDSKYESLREETFPQAFFPASQVPESLGAQNFELRTERLPSAVVSLVQDAVAQVDKGISLSFHSLAQQVDESFVQDRLLALLSSFFGALALLLATIGLYGAFSYLLAQRRIEFGIRMAIGAPRSSIFSMVMREVAAVFLAGALAGLAVSLAAVRLIQKMLFGITAHDSTALLAATALLALFALLAGYLPARRATHTDPAVALRYE
jgi:putative ABC transport system permease protein